MEYRYTPVSASSLNQVSVPFILRPAVKVEDHGGTCQSFSWDGHQAKHSIAGSIEVVLSSRLTTRTMENVFVELYLGEGATGASCLASHNASWSFNPRTLVGDRPRYYVRY